jgi:Fe-S oxidoreductase
VNHEESGREAYFKGFLEEAKLIAIKNVATFTLNRCCPLIGIEPSAILTFRDGVTLS